MTVCIFCLAHTNVRQRYNQTWRHKIDWTDELLVLLIFLRILHKNTHFSIWISVEDGMKRGCVVIFTDITSAKKCLLHDGVHLCSVDRSMTFLRRRKKMLKIPSNSRTHWLNCVQKMKVLITFCCFSFLLNDLRHTIHARFHSLITHSHFTWF